MTHSFHFGQPIIYYLVAGMAIATLICLVIAPFPRLVGKRKFEILFILSAGATLFACRWPILVWPDELNVDESTFIACALKATIDWVPWRGFDASTSGPLNPDILTLPILLGGNIGYFSARVIGLCLIAGAIGALYFAVKWIYGPGAARLSILPPVALLSLTKASDFVHYSSEHLPIFLTTVPLAVAAYLARGAESKTSRLLACTTAGLFLGCAPLAKLQSAPIALAVLILLVAAICSKPLRSSHIRKLEIMVVAASLIAIPSLVLIGLVTTGDFEDAVISYYKMTLVFAKGRPPVPQTFFFAGVREYTFFWVASLAVIVAGAAVLYSRVTFTRTFLWASLSSILLLLASLFAVQHAHQAFPHYLLFLIIPISFCVANVLGLLRQTGLGKRRAVFTRSLFVALFLAPIGFAALTSEADFSIRAMAPMRPDLLAVSRYVKPGDRLCVWAWRPDYYVKTRTIMATRSPGILVLMEPSRYREYFRNRFLSDLRANLPPVVVDGVAPGAFLYNDRATQGIESFPLLETFIREHYTQREEVAGVRIFVAKNLR